MTFARHLPRILSSLCLACGIVAGPLFAQSAAGVGPSRYKVNLPPSADLSYAITARQSGVRVDGDGLVRWSAGGGRFEIKSETRAALLGKILDTKSEGVIDEYGLAPVTFTEKRFRKQPVTTVFDRSGRAIRFGDSEQTHALEGGEQDRSSALWQLISIARAASGKFKPGSEWRFVVAGRKDAQPWVFRVLKQEKVGTSSGERDALHVSRVAPANSKDQLDIWLSPALEWYPVKVRFTEPDGDYIEETLQAVRKKSP